VASPNVALVRFADRVRSIASTGLDLLEIRGSEAGPALLDTLAGFDSIISWYGANREQFRDVTRQLGLPFEFLSPLPPEKAGNREPGAAPVHAVDFYLTQARRFSECNAGAVPRIPCLPAGSTPLRGPVRAGLLAGRRPPLHRQRLRHHSPGRRGRDTGRGPFWPHRPASVGAARQAGSGSGRRTARRVHGSDSGGGGHRSSPPTAGRGLIDKPHRTYSMGMDRPVPAGR